MVKCTDLNNFQTVQTVVPHYMTGRMYMTKQKEIVVLIISWHSYVNRSEDKQ